MADAKQPVDIDEKLPERVRPKVAWHFEERDMGLSSTAFLCYSNLKLSGLPAFFVVNFYTQPALSADAPLLQELDEHWTFRLFPLACHCKNGTVAHQQVRISQRQLRFEFRCKSCGQKQITHAPESARERVLEVRTESLGGWFE
jgi:hypothetical protein